MNWRTLLLLCLLCNSTRAVADRTQVTVYVDDAYKPFSYIEQGTAKGLYVDILTAAFRNMPNFEITIKAVPWDRGKLMMERGEGFAIAPVFFHGHDWPYLYPYSLPFFTEKIITVCSQKILEMRLSNWPKDFYSLHIGSVAGYDGWGGDAFHSAVRNKRITLTQTRSAAVLVQMLLKGRLDCIMTEELLFNIEIAKLQKLDSFSKHYHVKWQKGPTVGEDPVYIGYSEPAIKKGRYQFAGRFRKQFDIALYQLRKSGELQQIIGTYKESDKPHRSKN